MGAEPSFSPYSAENECLFGNAEGRSDTQKLIANGIEFDENDLCHLVTEIVCEHGRTLWSVLNGILESGEEHDVRTLFMIHALIPVAS